MTDRDFDPMLDCFLSWEAGIAELRRRWLAGEPISEGPWYKPPRTETAPQIDEVTP